MLSGGQFSELRPIYQGCLALPFVLARLSRFYLVIKCWHLLNKCINMKMIIMCMRVRVCYCCFIFAWDFSFYASAFLILFYYSHTQSLFCLQPLLKRPSS